MNDVFSTAAKLPVFTASHGHTYHKPLQKSIPSSGTALQQSKENTPMPEARPPTAERGVPSTDKKAAPKDSSARTLYDALQMTMRYGKEYMDDMPLMGEPGNFRFTKQKDPATTATQLRAQTAAQSVTSKPGTPVPPSRVVSPPPAIQTDVPIVQSKKSSAKSPGTGDPMKPKRRKSKAANQMSEMVAS